MDPAKRVTIVTGASSGIGAETAKLFAASGDVVVLAARRKDRLEALSKEIGRQKGESWVAPVDLCDPVQVSDLIGRTMERYGRIDVLVNNAGFGSQKEFADSAPEEIFKMFQVNVLSLMELTRLVIPIMKEQGSGSIVNVASVGGLMGHPLNVTYCASKHAVVGFSNSLRLELKGTGVSVTAVCPGGTRTEFFDVAEELSFPSYWSRFLASPIAVARAIKRATHRNRAVVYPTMQARMLILVARMLPWLADWGNLKYRDLVRKNHEVRPTPPSEPR